MGEARNASSQSYTADEVRAIVEATSGDFAGSSLGEHALGAFDCLRRAIPHTSLNVFLVRKGVATPVCTAGLIDRKGLDDYVSHYIRTDPMRTEFGNLASPASTLAQCARRDGVDLGRSEFLQDYALPRYRIRDIMGSNALLEDDVTFTFALHREPVLPRFAERDQVALKIALAPLARALRITYARERALEILRPPCAEEGTDVAEETAGVAVLDQHLDVIEVSPVARRVLRELDASGTLDEILRVTGSLVERLARMPARTTDETSLARAVGSRTASMRMLATRPTPRGPIRVYIFIDLVVSGQQVLVARMAHPYGLTRRELETIALLHEGLNLTEIARRLEVRPQTVRACLLGVRHKLRVRTNAQILPRLLNVR
jgi:DNA-binding CsgD family transcriptional regulator